MQESAPAPAGNASCFAAFAVRTDVDLKGGDLLRWRARALLAAPFASARG